MPLSSPRPFGLNQVKIVSSDGSDVATLDVSRVLGWTPRMLTGELTGSDRLAEVASFIEAAEWSLEEGGVPLDALAIMTGFTVSDSGSTPNQVRTLPIDAGTAMPYFKIYGKVLGVGADDVHIKIYKCKLTGNIEGDMSYGEFKTTGLSGIAVRDTVLGKVLDIVQNETAAALPSS